MNDIKEKKKKDYISFSEIHLFSMCPYKHFMRYHEGYKEPSSIHTVFGSAVHEAIELKWKKGLSSSWIKMGKMIVLFCRYHNQTEPDPEKHLDIKEWFSSAMRLYYDFWPWLDDNFPKSKIKDIEFRLEEPIEGFDKNFLGFIDLILYNEEDDKYDILDLKTTRFGWFKKQLSDTKKLYQVILYKKFYCEKLCIDPKKVDCHYLLLLRQPPKKEKYALKLYSVTSGEKKIQNAITWMQESIGKMSKGIKIKNPTTCSFCVCGAKK